MPNDIQKLKIGSESRSVLVVEDDNELAQSLVRILNVFFKECVIASDGEKAYSLFIEREEKNEPFTLVITDLELPKMGGLRLIKQIRARSDKQPILILSAHDEAEYMAEAIRLDVEAYLIKPLDMPKLFESLDKIFTYHPKNDSPLLFENDPVTGWKSFQELADRIHTVESPPFTLLRIRVNHLNNIFKFVGELFANEYITELSALLQNMTLDAQGEFYRIGNDEFCFVIEDKAIELANTIASNMVSVARYFHTSEKGIILNSSISIGIAYGKEHILLNSKLALENVEDHIGGGYNVYTLDDQDENSAFIKSHEILKMIFDALYEKNIVPFFVPIRDVRSNDIFAYESVVKIRYKNQLYGSETFRSIAIDMGQIGMITRWMIRHTFELSHILVPQKPIVLALSAIELSDESLLSYIEFWAERNQINPSNLCFHIIDGLKILKNSTLFDHVKLLQKNGFKIMISHFGIGEFDLLLLLSLRPDFIKLHPDLIAKGKSSDMHYILSKIVEISHKIDSQIIATGISETAELKWLQDTNVDAYNGPLSGDIFEVNHAK